MLFSINGDNYTERKPFFFFLVGGHEEIGQRFSYLLIRGLRRKRNALFLR